MNYSHKLCSLIETHVRVGAWHSKATINDRESVALKQLCSIFDVTCENFSSLNRALDTKHVTAEQYQASLAILDFYDIVPPPHKTSSNVVSIFKYLALHPDVPEHKMKIISGILGCTSDLQTVSGALYQQYEDEPRMQLILVILET